MKQVWFSRVVRDSYGLGLWKVIRCGWEDFRRRSHFIVGNGRRLKCWKDRWCSENFFEESFLDLIFIAIDKESWVAEF